MPSLWLQRQEFSLDGTLGRLFALGIGRDDPLWWTIEDACLPEHVKIKGETAIRPGIYDVVLSMSPRLKRVTPELLNVPMFAGIRIHALNRPEESRGCIGPGVGRVPGELAVVRSREAEREITTMLRQWGSKTTIRID